MNNLMSTFVTNINSYSGHAHNWKLSVEERLHDYAWLIGQMKKCRRDYGERILHIDGAGRSGYVGRLWENNLGFAGVRCVQYYRARAPAWIKGDLYGALTGSGTTDSILKRIKIAQEDGVVTWSMFSETEPNKKKEHVSDFSRKSFLVPGREEAIGEKKPRQESIGALRTYSEHSFALNGFSLAIALNESCESKKPVEEIIREKTYAVADYVSEVAYESTKKGFRENVNIMLDECSEKTLLLYVEIGPYMPIVRTLEVRTMHTGFDDRKQGVMVLDLEKYKNTEQRVRELIKINPRSVGAICIADKYFLDESSPFTGTKLTEWLYNLGVDIHFVTSERLNRKMERNARSVIRFKNKSYPLKDGFSIELSPLGSMVTIDSFLNCLAPEEEMERRHRIGE